MKSYVVGDVGKFLLDICYQGQCISVDSTKEPASKLLRYLKARAQGGTMVVLEPPGGLGEAA